MSLIQRTRRIASATIMGAGIIALTSCGASVDYDIEVKDENRVTAQINAGFPEDKGTETEIGEQLDRFIENMNQGEKPQRSNLEISDYKENGVVGKTFTIEDMDKNDYSQVLDMEVIKEDGKYIATVKNNGDAGLVFSSLSYDIKMPGKIITTSAGTSDGRTVAWNPNSAQGDLVIESKTYNPLAPLFVVGSSALVVLVVVATTVGKRKKKS